MEDKIAALAHTALPTFPVLASVSENRTWMWDLAFRAYKTTDRLFSSRGAIAWTDIPISSSYPVGRWIDRRKSAFASTGVAAITPLTVHQLA